MILFRGSQNQCRLSVGAKTYLVRLGMRWHLFLHGGVDKQPLPGPYLFLNGVLHKPFRLYPDTHHAFFRATRYSTACYCSSFANIEHRDPRPWHAGDNNGQVTVAVPSRLGSHIPRKPPLSHVRVGVKDNFDLQGTRTSLCSRSYLQLYPEKDNSAPCLQKLLDLGASIIGKTKLCAFAQWEEPIEATEYISPWNPRADGFQSSGGSSNGSGAAVAAYKWVDITIGSDSKPILVNATCNPY